MFEALIRQKKRVKVHCGKYLEAGSIEGIITKLDDQAGWIKIENVLLPIEWIAKIEVLEEED